MFNTIRLLYGEEILTKKEYKNFEKGNTIFGIDSNPKEIKRWKIEDEEKAIKTLKRLKCSYEKGIEDYYIEEYALEFFESDEEGEFIIGSDFMMAEED